MTSTTQSTSSNRIGLLLLLAVPAFFVLLGLGTWQMQRLAWKEGLINTINTRMEEAPAEWDYLVAGLESGELSQADLDYLPVTVDGVFDHSKERHFYATHKGISGYYIFTPLDVVDSNQTVFVNRGFVPYDLKDPATRPEGQVEGVQHIVGLARQRLDDKPGSFLPDNSPAQNIFYWKDLNAMATSTGLDPDDVVQFFVDVGFPTENYPLGVWPVPGVTIVNLPNNHLQYAVTWYGLAATLFFVLVAFVFTRSKK